MQRKSEILQWRPAGVSDTLDSTSAFPGAMASMQNLIPDPTTEGLWQCRPASLQLTAFGGFSSPGQISCYLVVGNLVYGMVATSRNAGNDEPFCYNLLTNLFITVTGTISGTTTPVSPPTSGDWQPPSMAVVGSKVVVCSSGFNGAASAAGSYFGWFDISNPLAPVWNAGNFSGPPAASLHFTTAPTGVAQFTGRAYFIHPLTSQPAVFWSDVNDPTQNTGTVIPVLTFGDNVQLTAIAGLPLATELGGIIQSLMVFKGVVSIHQITGDSSTNNLAVNTLNVATGTVAPNAITPTPKGLSFVAPDGLRLIDFDARVSDPIGAYGKGVTQPFILAVNPTRMASACNANILRISVFNGAVGGAPSQEYWYDFTRNQFSGPHSFPASLIEAWMGTFVEAPQGVPAKLFRSDASQSLTSTFVENGNQLQWQYFTSYLPDDDMVNYELHEAILQLALAAGTPPVQIAAVSWTGGVIDTIQIFAPATSTIWGAFTWGGALWGGLQQALTNLELQWHMSMVFDRLQLQVSGQSALAFRIGVLKGRYQRLRTWRNIAAVS